MVADSKQLVIETMGLTKVFRDFWGHNRVVAVDKLNLEIRSEEVFGLLGPNGSGKSTTIKMLLGLLFPTKGGCRVLGMPPGDVKTNYRIGYLPEESYLYPYLNARETLDFYGRLFGLNSLERKRRTESLLQMVGLGSVARRPIGEFSKGMTRRIGLAQALINDPDLLILDEPTSGLDPIGTRQIKDLIVALGKRGKTVLLCSHLLADVEDVCDRIGILYGGQLRALGSVDELLTRSEMTQIRSRKLSAGAIDKIQKIIQSEHAETVDIQNPRDRLEDYFLQIVSEAQAEKLQTSGAILGSGVSDFLTSRETEEVVTKKVLDELVTSEETRAGEDITGRTEAETVQPVESVKDFELVDHQVLDSLVEVPIDTVSTEPVEPSHKKKGPSEKDGTVDAYPKDASDMLVDKSVIDALISKHKDKEKETPEDKSTDDSKDTPSRDS
jgi:ABC-2 type transport system ATP-binding protein